MTNYKWIIPEAAGKVPEDVLSQLEEICEERRKKLKILEIELGDKFPGLEYKFMEASNVLSKDSMGELLTRRETQIRDYNKKERETTSAIKQEFLKKLKELLKTPEQTYLPLDCTVDFAETQSGVSEQFVERGPIMIGGPTDGEYVHNNWGGTQIDVTSEEYPQLKKLQFPSSITLEKGDTIRAYLQRQIDITDVVKEEALNWDYLERDDEQRFLVRYPQESEETNKIEKLRDGIIVARSIHQ